MMTSKLYCIVHFLDTDEVEIAPKTWIKCTDVDEHLECYWPLFKSQQKILKAVQTCVDVETDKWKSYKARILKNYDSYESAVKDITKAKEKSDLGTDVSDVDDGTMQCKQKRARNSYLPLSDTDICSSPEINFCLQKGNSQLAKPKKNLSESLAQKSHKKLSIEYEDLPEPPVFSNSHLNCNTPEHVTSRSSGLSSILSSFSKPHGKPLLKELPLCSSDGWLYSVATRIY
nr:uncharacterized protein LOC124812057 isoform X2 [Hydra vulgaris]